MQVPPRVISAQADKFTQSAQGLTAMRASLWVRATLTNRKDLVSRSLHAHSPKRVLCLASRMRQRIAVTPTTSNRRLIAVAHPGDTAQSGLATGGVLGRDQAGARRKSQRAGVALRSWIEPGEPCGNEAANAGNGGRPCAPALAAVRQALPVACWPPRCQSRRPPAGSG